VQFGGATIRAVNSSASTELPLFIFSLVAPDSLAPGHDPISGIRAEDRNRALWSVLKDQWLDLVRFKAMRLVSHAFTSSRNQQAGDVVHRHSVVQILVSVGDQEAATDDLAVVTFVPAHADIRRFSKRITALDRRNLLIHMNPANDLRIRNAWVRGSNPLCGTNF
jgi:hypothetical protein